MDPRNPTNYRLEKIKRLREQIKTVMNKFQNDMERALGILSESNPGGAPVGANSDIVTGKSSSANLASHSTADPSSISSVRKRACSPENQISSKKRHRTDKDDQTSSIKLKNTVPSIAKQNDSSQAQKRKYKTKRRTVDKQSISKQKEIQAMKVFQDAIAKALGISTATGTSGTGTQIASTSVPNTNLAGNLEATQSTSSSVRKRTSPSSEGEEEPTKKKKQEEHNKAKKKNYKSTSKTTSLWNPKRFRLRLGKGPKVHPKALERKPEAQQIQEKEDCTTDDIFPPRAVVMTRLRERAPRMKIKDMLRMIRSEQSEKKDDSPTN
ncbi:hypothetical protein XELAEV_18036935mg [Xenopus laevis]|uniref:Uncharacterized protein n=1 Tax=Xenopus laevis TaxID=8355 RepID=A0A974H9Q2_XENLA|nr:hypothetical protein XELAEV_18036935mg [Xenopus laevis]